MNQTTDDITNKLSRVDIEGANVIKEEDYRNIQEIGTTAESLPQMNSTEITDEMYNIAYDQVQLLSNNSTLKSLSEAEVDIVLDVVDETFKVKKGRNSTANFSVIKEELDQFTSNYLTLTSNITNTIQNNGNNTILFKGDTFSISIQDNSEEANEQARENNLPIIDTQDCEKKLKEAGVLSQDDKLYTLNTIYDSHLLEENLNNQDFRIPSALSKSSEGVTEELEGQIQSAGKGITTKIINSRGDVIDTTGICNEFTVKIPINTNKYNNTEYDKLLNELEVDLLNGTDTFFSDRCFKFSGENGTDVTLNSRRKEFNVTSICSQNCEYQGLDEHGSALCMCSEPPTEVSSSLAFSSFGPLQNSNFRIITCFSQAFNREYFPHNYGTWSYAAVIISLAILTTANLVFSSITALSTSEINKIVLEDAVFIHAAPHNVGKKIEKEVPKAINENTNSSNEDNREPNNIVHHPSENNNNNNNTVIEIHDIPNSQIPCNNQVDSDIVPSIRAQTHQDNINNTNHPKNINNDISNQANNNNKNNNGNSVNSNSRNNQNLEGYKTNNFIEEEIIMSENRLVRKENKNAHSKFFKSNLRDLPSHKTSGEVDIITGNLTISKKGSVREEQEEEYINIEDINYHLEELEEKLKKRDLTKNDLSELPLAIAIRVDKRSFWRYFWDDMVETNNFLNLILVKSMMNPFIVRLYAVFVSYSLDFALNALFFTDDYIDGQASHKLENGEDSTGFW
eukprot:CAMPEP_0170522680 /NCGR_PEP_ID=MMETSP0209-20121228/8102_1 /TAXON_ID=665100 ORGANISM="Litonotus pictus, Strain P1" /NCGR_SAMPLE_ID=MMETSP0209 /ASSEMBLY_ACC=CAM_ASM_000301 /LENGTH=737 /DNA_ID=CAMNT_0010810315 /DNA_START=3940 /DNA_END=6150 /DNA_ORIENTATION=-